ncbi:MAG: HNH endonuclease family protein, partial [Candidatus Binatia bacterium]
AEEYVDRIGNLTLLTAKVNEKIANQSFQKKKESAFKTSKLALNTDLKRAKKWGDKEIEKRQKEMAKLAVQIWEL